MSKSNQHVIPHGDGWAVKRAGSRRISYVFKTKREAIDAARQLVRRGHGELIVHGTSGQIFQSSATPSRLKEEEIRTAVRALYVPRRIHRSRSARIELTDGELRLVSLAKGKKSLAKPASDRATKKAKTQASKTTGKKTSGKKSAKKQKSSKK